MFSRHFWTMGRLLSHSFGVPISLSSERKLNVQTRTTAVLILCVMALFYPVKKRRLE
jgi:hypothetical protein